MRFCIIFLCTCALLTLQSIPVHSQLTWFETNFQVFCGPDSTGRMESIIYHDDMSVIADYCNLVVLYGNVELINYTFKDNGDWKTFDQEIYYYVDDVVTFIVNKRERWLFADDQIRRLQLYYEIPKRFTIKL